MKTFYIPDLIPLEDFIREKSLRFLTQVHRNLGSFSYLILSPPYVRKIDNWFYLEDGNHRCVWSMINGIFIIEAEEEIPDESDFYATLSTIKSARKSGIYCMDDLVNRVEEPKQYSSLGPIEHKITKENLKNPDYFLRV